MRKKIAAAIICLGIAACAAPPAVTPQSAGPVPENYKAILKAHIEKNYFDPYSLRNVAISKPALGKIGSEPGWLVCLQNNAKNRMGGYVGLKKDAYLIRNGGIIGSEDAALVCDTLQLEPWPEMEMGRSSK
jgi:hypothetical protein